MFNDIKSNRETIYSNLNLYNIYSKNLKFKKRIDINEFNKKKRDLNISLNVYDKKSSKVKNLFLNNNQKETIFSSTNSDLKNYKPLANRKHFNQRNISKESRKTIKSGKKNLLSNENPFRVNNKNKINLKNKDKKKDNNLVKFTTNLINWKNNLFKEKNKSLSKIVDSSFKNYRLKNIIKFNNIEFYNKIK